MKKESRKAIGKLIDLRGDSFKETATLILESDNPYMTLLDVSSRAHIELEKMHKDREGRLMSESFMLAFMVHYGVPYLTVYRVADDLEMRSGFMAAMEMLNDYLTTSVS